MIPPRRRKNSNRLPILGVLAVGAAVLAMLAHTPTGGSLLTALTPEPAPGSVANPYCRSQPSGDL
ncbi:MAG: hypothetical protein VYD00_02955, partial [Pseudomonadota bacterium]|nr:hypothetical protein [Pseudomonadota bacterium]